MFPPVLYELFLDSKDLRYCLSRGYCDIHPPGPIKKRLRRMLTMEMRDQAQIWHVLIHNESFLSFLAVTSYTQEILVANTSKNLDFYSKIYLFSVTPCFQSLDCNLQTTTNTH